MEQQCNTLNKKMMHPQVNQHDKRFIQQVTGTFPCYAWAIDNNMLIALSAITAEQAAPTHRIMECVLQFLDFATTQAETTLM